VKYYFIEIKCNFVLPYRCWRDPPRASAIPTTTGGVVVGSLQVPLVGVRAVGPVRIIVVVVAPVVVEAGGLVFVHDARRRPRLVQSRQDYHHHMTSL
jgi:hypothetical protein